MMQNVTAERESSTESPHDALDARVRTALAELARPRPQEDHSGVSSAASEELLAVFDAMAASRLIDITARRLRQRGLGYYTIGSAGHESNAYVAAALRPTDPALLHYRSGAFYLRRALQAGRGLDEAIDAILLSMFAAVADPASGGRHKVFGDPQLAIIPQTSTIASHPPRAVGVAFAIERARRIGVLTRWPSDAVTVCSFGDASANHSTAVGALNAAGYCAAQGLPLPIVFVCEDNGLGISVPSPTGWLPQALRRPGIKYFTASGDDPQAVRAAAQQAVELARVFRKPALLHLRTVRYLAHAGTDVESSYRSRASIRADVTRDPLIASAVELAKNDNLDINLEARYSELAGRVSSLAQRASLAPRLASRSTVIAPLAPREPEPIAAAAARTATASRRENVFNGKLPETSGAMTLAQCINAALTDAMAAHENMLVFGEDVAVKGGVYGVSRGLQQRFGAARAFDTLLDEQSVLGLGLGLGVSGLLPVPEIQYLAYLHNAADQLRGEAASLRFFSNGTYTNPMVVRIAGLAYQRGFGGHFHNDNAVAALLDIPGLVVAVPSRPEDAAPMLRSCLAAAELYGQVSVFLEPIALYHERDLHAEGDHGWLGNYSPITSAPIGTGRVHGAGTDLTMITFGNGLRMSLRVAARLAAHGITSRVLDLRWLSPLPVDDILAQANATGRVLVVDETRHSGGVGAGVIAELVEGGFTGRISRVASADSFIPLGEAANLVLLSEDEIQSAARR